MHKHLDIVILCLCVLHTKYFFVASTTENLMNFKLNDNTKNDSNIRQRNDENLSNTEKNQINSFAKNYSNILEFLIFL